MSEYQKTVPENSRGFCRKLAGLSLMLLALAMTRESDAQSIDPPFVQVGDVGNAPDPLTGRGRVNYDYRIGKYDITISEYTTFLNAVARRDKYRLYSIHKMDQIGEWAPSNNVDSKNNRGSAGIMRSGEAGSYTYQVIKDSGKIPVVYVTWFDAARFCNWMHNGQPADPESTETGAYTLNGDRSKGGQTRNPGAKYWIPSADEWYKAAHYDPQLNGGTGGYWKYATRSNAAPGNEIGDGKNEANGLVDGMGQMVKAKRGQALCVFTPVGSYPNSRSFYGCLDMCGNVSQWTDTYVHTRYKYADGRGTVGGGAAAFTWELTSTMSACTLSGYLEREDFGEGGFRIATTPEPAQAKPLRPLVTK